MAIAIRGGSPLVAAGTTATISGTLTGTRQPQAGDVLLIIHGNDYYTASAMPTPTVGGSTTGVTTVTGGSADAGTNLAHIKSYTYVVGSAGDLTVAVTETGSADEDKCLVVYVLSGVDTSTTVDGAAGGSGTSTSSQVAPSVSPSSSDAFLVCHVNTGGGATAGTWTPPSGMSEQYDQVTGGIGLSGATVQLVASGATGTKTFTSTGSAPYATITIALLTGAGVAPLRPAAVTVVTAAAPVRPVAPLLVRGVLADPPVLTTGSPRVVTTSPARPAAPAILLRTAAAAVVVSPAATGSPLVVTAGLQPTPSRPVLTRGSLADLVAVSTPLVVAAPPASVRGTVWLSREPLPPPVLGPPGPSTAPQVVTAPRSPLSGMAILLRSPLQAGICDCTTHRPAIGVTARPAGGATSRPALGVTTRPCSC